MVAYATVLTGIQTSVLTLSNYRSLLGVADARLPEQDLQISSEFENPGSKSLGGIVMSGNNSQLLREGKIERQGVSTFCRF